MPVGPSPRQGLRRPTTTRSWTERYHLLRGGAPDTRHATNDATQYYRSQTNLPTVAPPKTQLRRIGPPSPLNKVCGRHEELSYSVIQHLETSGASHYTRRLMPAMVTIASGRTHRTNTLPHRNPAGGNETRRIQKIMYTKSLGGTRETITQTKPIPGGRL